MEDLFLNIAKWCLSFDVVYNLCYHNDVYEFSFRFPNCCTVSSVDLTILLDYFSHRNENWCASVRFDKDCIRLTYAKISVI